jgi:anthranilate 1,2-dioxygenase small subunit
MRPAPIGPDLRSRIEDLFSSYAHALDDDELERWPGFFAEDGFYQIIPRESFEANQPVGILSCAGRGMMQDRIDALRAANIFEPHTYCHILARPALNGIAEGAIQARTNFAVYRTMQGGSTTLFAAGKYLDVLVPQGERLQFKSRRVILESRRVDILIVVPI